jgi:hypothetical protein
MPPTIPASIWLSILEFYVRPNKNYQILLDFSPGLSYK